MDWYNSAGMMLYTRRSEHIVSSPLSKSEAAPQDIHTIEDPRRAFGSKLAEGLLMEVAIASLQQSWERRRSTPSPQE